MKKISAQKILNDQFLQACKEGNLPEVKRLLTHPKKRAEINCEGGYGLIHACDYEHFSIVQYLLSSKELPIHSDIHANKDYPIRTACMKGNMDIVKYLLTSPEIIDAGGTHANLHAENDLALIHACTFNRLPLVQYLLTTPDLLTMGYPDIHAQDDLPIRSACHYGDVNLVKYLLTSPDLVAVGHTYPDIHARRDEAFTGACENNEKDGRAIIEYLIMDYGIPMTPTIESFLSLPNDNHISNGDIDILFKRGNLEENLQSTLGHKTNNGTKNKI